MTDIEGDIYPKVSAAETVEDCAADWVAAKRNQKDWTQIRQADLDAWLAQSLMHRVAYIRIDATWRRTERVAALRRPMRGPIVGSASTRAPWMRIAVVLGVLAVTGAVAGSYLSYPHSQLVETPKGGQERLTLSDGSLVELNTDTALRVRFSAGTRSVELVRGEAFFQVRHDAARPFVVTADQHRIVDIGTKFLVRLNPKSVNIELVEGSALLENIGRQNLQRPLTLLPGDVAVATATATRVSKKTSRGLSESLAWRRGSVVFHNERLVDAIAELNRYGGLQLVVADESAAHLTINGTFLTNKPEDFAGITHEIFGLRVERRDGNLILSR